MRFLAVEKLSDHKYKTPEGYLICVDSILSRTGKQEYRRSEIFGDGCKDAEQLVNVDRLPDDVFDEKALASFENKPLCIEHPNEDVNVANHNDLSVGFVRDIKRGNIDGQDVMLGTLVVTDEHAIDLIESGEYAELSCGYDCDIADDEHPTQKNIRGNHVALCQKGRAGIAKIVDSIDDNPDFETNSGRQQIYEHEVQVALDKAKVPVRRWNKTGSKFNIDNNSITIVATSSGIVCKSPNATKKCETSDEVAQFIKAQLNDSKGGVMKDANYEQWTKQGYRVAALYKDGGRIHAIVERKSGDFVVALGYNTSTGEWAQGRYVSTFGAAIDTLNEEKPGAVPIRDTAKLFTVSFVEDGVTYIRKVKANNMQDAIRKVSDERFSPMTYKALKEFGVNANQWKNWTQKQASEYIAKHKSKQGEEKSEKKTSAQSASSMKSLAKEIETSHKKEDIEAYRSEVQKYLPDKSKIENYKDAKNALQEMLKKMGFEEDKDYVINEKIKMVGHGIKYPSVSALTLKAKPSSALSESYVASITENALNNVFKYDRSSINNSGWTYTFKLDE